jgi:hypothetical protein
MSVDDRLRAASTDVRATTTGALPPTESDMRGRHRHRVAWLTTAVILLVAVPVAAVVVARRTTDPTISTAANPTVTTPPNEAAVGWSTGQVDLLARSITVESAGTTRSVPSDASARSDPGTQNSYTTLEVSWPDSGGEMRLNIYLKSDGVDWWADEIRVYEQPGGDWVTFTGEYFRSPLGQRFESDLELIDGGTEGSATIRFDGLDLQAFLPPVGCLTEPGAVSLEVLYPTIEMGGPGSGYGVNVRLLDANCREVTNYNDYQFDWAVADPELVAVTPGLAGCESCLPQHADLTATGSGTTELTVTVTPIEGDQPVATGTMDVTVT